MEKSTFCTFTHVSARCTDVLMQLIYLQTTASSSVVQYVCASSAYCAASSHAGETLCSVLGFYYQTVTRSILLFL